MIVVANGKPKKRDPGPPPEDEDEMFSWRLKSFLNLGFDEVVALALAWADASPSEINERWLKRGATHKQAANEFL